MTHEQVNAVMLVFGSGVVVGAIATLIGVLAGICVTRWS